MRDSDFVRERDTGHVTHTHIEPKTKSEKKKNRETDNKINVRKPAFS